jgi:NAD(P)-dependent dehydrogenase (short-subunit alcohol dehydrogenase family)
VLAAEVAEFGIQADAVWPGVVETRFHEALRNATLEEAGPGRLGRAKRPPTLLPRDCSPLFVFLASDASNDVTGEFLKVDDAAIRERVKALLG